MEWELNDMGLFLSPSILDRKSLSTIYIYLKRSVQTEIHLSEDKLLSFPQKDFFRSEGKCWCLLLYNPEVLGGTSDIVDTP